MTKDWKVLILFASYGSGHYQVSRVLEEGFVEKGIQHVRLLDLFEEAHPWINGITQYIYRKSFSFASTFLYGWTYYATRNMQHDTLLSRWFHLFGAQKLRELIEEEQPDIIVNTFPMLVMPMLRKRDGITIPTVTVLTDFALHNRWIHSEIDRYYIPAKDLEYGLKNRGIHPAKIRVTGIPIKKEFEHTFSLHPTIIFEKWGLDPSKRFVLVMAEAYGKKVLKKICKAFLSHSHFDLLVVCGKNQDLKTELEKDFSQTNIHIYGFVEEIYELMKVSSCILTKAGGITLSEAIAMELPMVLLQPVPGQEKENARYLQEKGAAITVSHIEGITDQIFWLLRDESLLFNIKQATRSLHYAEATENIIRDILAILNEPHRTNCQSV